MTPPMTAGEKVAYDMGFRDAMDRRKVYVDFEEELNVPVEWAEYTDQEEREIIVAIVEMPEFQEHFKTNMVRQAMLKWRQARLHANDPEKTKLFFSVGNFIMELVEFYSHAKDPLTQKVEETDGFSSFPEPE